MNKGLEALNDARENLEEIDGHVGFDYGFEIREIKDDFDIIEKELKALEIIKSKQVDIALFVKSKSAVDYNGLRMTMFRKQAERDYSGVLLKYGLTKEEYDLLKEVLL